MKQKHIDLRMQILTHYGGNPPICKCCGEKEIKFLAIDHIDGFGNAHKRKVGHSDKFYNWIKKNNYPPTLQILCHNCNMAKGFYGKCPHQEKHD